MKLSTAYAEPGDATIVVGAVQQKGAHLAVDASIFNILSRMYSKPEEAVTRELLCNANDAHVVAGRASTAIELFLPNSMKPEWTLRDHGTGLSKEDVFRYIGGYGESDKRSDLRVIGGFGIGAKSPFAVTSQFTITSWHGGRRMLFAFYKDDEDKPVLSLMDDQPSDEPTGMRFSFAVPSSRIEAYIKATEIVLARWKGAPVTIYGAGGRVFSKVKYRIERPLFGLRDHMSANTYRPVGVFATMGGVAYPLDVKQLSAKYHALHDANLDIFFEIGDVKPSPSRESLEMTPAVVKAIENRLDTVSANIRDEAQALVGKPATFLEAIRAKTKLKEFTSTLPATFRQFIVADITFQGVPVPDDSYSVRLDLPNNIRYTTGSVKDDHVDGVERLTRYAEMSFHSHSYNGLILNNLTAFMFRRDPSESDLVAYNRLINLSNATVPRAVARGVVVIHAPRTQEIVDRLAVYGITEDLGDLEDIPPAVVPKKVREKTKMRRLKSSRSADYSGDWEELEVDLEAGGIYQILERGRPTCAWMSQFMTLMRHLEEPLPTIYGIPLSTKSRLTRHKKAWRTFEDWALERLKTLPIGDYLTSITNYDERKNLTWINKLHNTTWRDELDKNSEVYKLLKDIERWNANRAVWREEASQVIAMLTDLRIDIQPVPSQWNFASREAKLTSEYPLVTAFIRHAPLHLLPAETKKLIFDNLA